MNLNHTHEGLLKLPTSGMPAAMRLKIISIVKLICEEMNIRSYLSEGFASGMIGD
jgi:hypothetical protein